MTATLYGIPASHPTYAATLMLERKGIEYKRIDLPQWFHRPLLRILRFHGTTVPALVLDGRRRQTTKAIARALDAERPEPRLVPTTRTSARESRPSRRGATATSSSSADGSCTGRSSGAARRSTGSCSRRRRRS